MSTIDIIYLAAFYIVLVAVVPFVIWLACRPSRKEINAKKLEELEEADAVLAVLENALEDTMSKSSFSRLTGVEAWLKDEARKHLYYV